MDLVGAVNSAIPEENLTTELTKNLTLLMKKDNNFSENQQHQTITSHLPLTPWLVSYTG